MTLIDDKRTLRSAMLAWRGALSGDERRAAAAGLLATFKEAMRSRGYVDGQNMRIAFRVGDATPASLARLAEGLVADKVDVIVAWFTPSVRAAMQATSEIPIVMAGAGDPVATGLVASLGHPGGNVTGLANFAEELASKQIDVIHELLPRLARVAALINVANPLHVPQLRETQAAAAKASLALVHFEFRVPADLEQAFDQFVRAKAEALLVPPDTTFSTNRARIAELAAKARLPAIYGDRRAVESGGLLSYGPNVVENYRRSAAYVDKILKGANPADLPVEQPTKIELAINLKTAKALGLTVPPTLLNRADEVIE